MTIRVKIAGTNRSVYPPSLKVNGKVNGQSTAEFSIRTADSDLTFAQGQSVIIYDDNRTESVLVTKDKTTPYGPPGVVWQSADDGGQLWNSSFDVKSSNQPDGTVEFLFSVENGLDSAAALGYDILAVLELMNADYYTNLLRFDLHLDSGAFYPRLHLEDADVNIDSTSPIEEETVYRISIQWSYSGGNTTVRLRVNSYSAGTHVIAGYLFGADPCHGKMFLQWGSSVIGEYVADVRFWDMARSGGDIEADMFLRLVGTEADLRFYWKCDEGTGTMCEDTTANNIDGTFNAVDGLIPAWGTTADDWLGAYPLSDASEYQVLDFRYFGGLISDVKRIKIGPAVFEWNISCTDWSSLPYRTLLAPITVSSKHMQDVLRHIVLMHLPNELIGTYAIVEGPLVKSAKWIYAYMGKAFDQLRDMTHWAWIVDPYKEVRIIPPDGLSPAPFDIADADDPKNYLEMDYTESKGKYFNRLVARVKVIISGTQHNYYIICQNDAEIAARAAIEGGSGVYEAYEDIADCGTLDQALDVIIGRVESASQRTIELFYRTRNKGMRVGQLQHIQNSDRGIDGDFLSTEVSMFLAEGSDEQYTVKASESISPTDLSNALVTALDSKSNFKDELTYFMQTVQGIRDSDELILGDTATVESGIE